MKTNITLFFLVLSIAVYAQAGNSAELVAKYTFENNLVNQLNPSVSGEALAQANGTLPTFEQNADRGGTVLHQYFGFNDVSSISYVRFPNPLQGVEDLTGVSISLWINRLEDPDVWDGIWAFLDEDDSDGVTGRFYLTPNAYLGFKGTGGWFDCNWPDNPTNAIPVDQWSMITVTADAQGFHLYIDGQLRYHINNYLAWAAGDDITPTSFPYQSIVNLVKSAANFYLGYGSWWGSLNILTDDLSIYKGVLSDTEVTALYNSYTGIKNPNSNLEINYSYNKQANTISVNHLKGNEKIELFNVTGQKIVSTNQSIIYTGNLNKGIYLLRISEGNTSNVKKLIIQ
jgi:arabinan endo-1,5-alpha-L-arabinosidase